MGDRSRSQDRMEKTFKTGTYRGMLYGIVLREYPKQVVSLAKAKRVLANMREFLAWGTETLPYRRNSIRCRTQGGWLASAGPCPGGCQEFSHRGSTALFIRLTCKICGTVRKEERHVQGQDPATCPQRHTDHRESNAHTRKTYCDGCH